MAGASASAVPENRNPVEFTFKPASLLKWDVNELVAAMSVVHTSVGMYTLEAHYLGDDTLLFTIFFRETPIRAFQTLRSYRTVAEAVKLAREVDTLFVSGMPTDNSPHPLVECIRGEYLSDDEACEVVEFERSVMNGMVNIHLMFGFTYLPIENDIEVPMPSAFQEWFNGQH